MARSSLVIFVALLGIAAVYGRDSFAYDHGSAYTAGGVKTAAYATSYQGKTISKASANSAAFAKLRNAATKSIAKAIAAVYKGDVHAHAHAIAISTAHAVAEAYASSYAAVIVKGKGKGAAHAQAHAEAFAKAIAEAYAAAFSHATDYKFHAAAKAISYAISKGVAHALVHTKYSIPQRGQGREGALFRVSVKVNHRGYAEAAEKEYVKAVTKIVAAAFADALAIVKKHGPYGAENKSYSGAIADSYTQDLSKTYSDGYKVQYGNAKVHTKSVSHKTSAQIYPWDVKSDHQGW